MEKFHFNLERVLSLRVRLEDEARLELGRAVSALNAIEEEIRVTGERKDAAQAERFAGTRVNDILYYDAYISRLEADTERLLGDRTEAEAVVESAREAYLEKSRDRKSLDKLKDKRKAEYNREAKASENRANDDIVNGKRLRQALLQS
jgi:flagellar FliJ protein